MENLYFNKLFVGKDFVQLIYSSQSTPPVTEPEFKGLDACISLTRDMKTPEEFNFLPHVGADFITRAPSAIAGFLSNLSLDVKLSKDDLFYAKDIAFLTTSGGLTTLTQDFGKITMSKFVSLKKAGVLLIHEPFNDTLKHDFRVIICEYPLRLSLKGVSTYAFFRRFSLLMSFACTAMNWTLGKELETPMSGYVLPGLKTKLDYITEFKTQINIPEFKAYFLTSHDTFDWITAINSLMLQHCCADFRESKLLSLCDFKNLKSVLFPIKSEQDPVVAVHNFMRHTFENKCFRSLDSFYYPLRDGKVMSVKSKSNFLRNQFRKYSSDEKKCIVYIPGTLCYGEGESDDKGKALLAACTDFIKYYEICTVEELNEYSKACPRCNLTHEIQECPV
jgi:hypothetical protein